MKIYLDTRRPMADGRFPLRLSSCFHGKSFLISLNISLNKDQFKDGKIINHPKKAQLNNYIQHISLDIEDMIIDLKHRGEYHSLSLEEYKCKLQNIIAPKASRYLLGDVISMITEGKSVSTKNIYMCVLNLFGNVELSSITNNFVENKLVNSTLMDSSKKTYISKLICILNYAMKIGYIHAVPELKIDNSRKVVHRNMDVNSLRSIIKHGGYACDMFALSFYLIGMNTADMMEIDGMDSDRINYSRKKTKHQLSVKVQPEALAIINRYKSDDKIIGRRFNKVISFTHHVNKELQILFPEVKADGKPLSMYWARHSWASIAAEIDIPRDVIAAALGHTWSDVTSVYIATNQKKVDDANRKVIDYVLNYQQK